MANSPKRIAFAISDTGGGHRSAATALIAALKLKCDSQCSIHDILRMTKVPGLKQAPEIYDYCSKNHLWLNNLFFRKTNSISRINALTNMVFLQSRHRIEREMQNAQPDAVVAVHPLVIGLLRKARDKCRAHWPIITVVTDLVTIHASWATPGADLYLVATKEAYDALEQCKIPSSKIINTGFPVHPKFSYYSQTKQESRQELGIESDRFTVMTTGGGVGAGNMSEWINALEKQCDYAQILVVTGNNKVLYQELVKRQAYSPRLYVFGFVNNMETLMAASDVIVTKAGPGTIMEGVALNRPLIITGAVGIQETGNIDYVTQNRLGFHCPDPLDACSMINEIAAGTQNGLACGSEAITTDGSIRIADIILEQIAAEPLPKKKGGNISLGA